MRALRWLSWTAVATPFVLLLCHEWFGPDIWYHLYLGRRVAETGLAQPPDHLILQQPNFINLYWLFQLTIWGGYALGGMVAVSVLFIGVWAVALGVSLRTAGAARAGAWGPWLALALVLVGQTRFEQRPEIFSYAFLALQIHWLATWRPERPPTAWALLRFTLAQVAWSNMHGYFAFGPLLVGLKLASLAPEWRGPDWARHRPGRIGLAQLLGLTLLASVASPFGGRNWEEVAELWHFLGAMRYQIQEFIPSYGLPWQWWTVKFFWAYWVALAAAGGFVLATAARRELFALLLAALGLYLSATAYRNIPLVIMLGAPLVGAILPAIGRRLRAEAPARLAAIAAGAALSCWVAGGGFYRSISSSSAFGIHASEYAYPTDFADYLRATGFRGTLFERGADGGYLEFHFPELRIYGDSRFTNAPLVTDYFAAVRSPAAFRLLQRRYDFDAALFDVTESHEIVTALLQDSHWRMAYADLYRVLLVNLDSAVGRAAAVQSPRFYRGEDLTIPYVGVSMIHWIDILSLSGDRGNLLLALRQLAPAPRIPALALESALNYARNLHDPDVAAAVRALRPHLEADTPADGEAVDWLLRQMPP